MADVSPPPELTSQRPVRRRRRFVFVALAVIAGCLPFVLLEAGLRVAGVGADVTYQDPLVGFSRTSPLFEVDDADGVYRTSRSRRVLFGMQEFAIKKPQNGFRIFCLGGSTVRGRPYTTESAFSRWLQIELADRDPSHTYEVVNCGGLSYASYRLAQVLQEVLAYEPDLIVIATGHNEFLEDRTYKDIKQRSATRAWVEDRLQRLRIVRVVRDWGESETDEATAESEGRTVLPDLVDTRLDQASGYASYHRDDEWAANVEAHFEQSLRSMATMCDGADVPALFVLLGSNVRDCPPFKSEHRPQLDIGDERTWQTLFDEAQATEESDPKTAVDDYLSAADIDAEHALLRFRIGRLLDGLGRADEAADHYLAAKDFDVCPLRMRESFAQTLRNVAEETQTPLVDARTLIQSKADDRLPGNDYYMDHVHPSIGSHQQIARAIAAQIEQEAWSPAMAGWSVAERRDAYETHMTELGRQHFVEGYERVSWVENWAQRQRLLDETLPRNPLAHIRYGHRLWDFARPDEAWEHYQAALDADPELADRLRRRADQLIDQGRASEADDLLDRLSKADASELPSFEP